MNPVFAQVCDRILKKECVPFIGSGVSIQAKYIGQSKPFLDRAGHTVNGLKKALRKKQPDWRNKTLGGLCEETLWANRITSKNALKNLVTKLEIAEFTNLSPTQAHNCLALLVREGLLPQIFTTNYDTALERAFVNSFGSEWESNKEDDRLSVVHDQKNCTHQRRGTQGSGDVLHLYKINGCADALRQDKDGGYSSKILLTMTQLQSWRERRWAKDTFRVSLRSNTVLFSGFGSDEPQVIHTVQQILDEYSSLTDNSNKSPNIQNLPPNAPVVHSFEPNPMFCQLQIVNNYTQAYFGKYNSEFSEKLILTKKSIDADTSSNDNLSADDFWFRVYQEIQKRIVADILTSASTGQLAVSALPQSNLIFGDIAKETKDDKGKLSPLFNVTKGNNLDKWQTLLPGCLSQLLTNGKEYVPLNLNKNMAAEFIWLLWSTQANIETLEVMEDAPRGNLLSAQQVDGKPFLMLAKRQHQGQYNEDKISPAPALASFCLTAVFSDGAPILKEFRLTRTVNGSRSMNRVYVFTFSDIFQIMNQDEFSNKGQHRKIMEAIIRSPSRYRANQYKTKRQRYGVENES